jgi:GNAT superfamily N-acetyltransferase
MAEQVEAEFMYSYVSGAPAAVGAALGIATTRIGGGVVLAMSDDPVGYWNKALGFGISEPVTGKTIEEILGFYRDNGVTDAVLQIAPALLPPDWPEIRTAQGISVGRASVKLGAAIDEVRLETPTGLRVGPVTADDVPRWAAVVLEGFGMADERINRMIEAAVTDAGFRPFAAWDGDEVVAGANLFFHGPVASLNSGATLSGHRGRGAQSALIAARIDAARRGGCEWVMAETELPEPGSVNPSLDNLQRAGLRRLYIRHDWLWHAPEGGADKD